MLAEPRAILFERPDLDRAAGASARRQEAMPVGHRSGRDLLDQGTRRVRRPSNRERHDAAAVEKQQPPDRAPEQQFSPAVVEHRVPVHLLGEREIAQHAGKQVGQRIHGALPAHALAHEQVRALRCFLTFDRLERDPLFAREANRRGGRLSRSGERSRDRGTHHDVLEILLTLRQAADARRQSPRRAEGFDGNVGRHPHLAQPRLDPLRQLLRQPRQPCGRQFLDPDLDSSSRSMIS